MSRPFIVSTWTEVDRQAGLDGHEQALRCLNLDMGYRALPGSGEGRGQKGDGKYSGDGSQEVVSWGRLELTDWGTPLQGRQGWVGQIGAGGCRLLQR